MDKIVHISPYMITILDGKLYYRNEYEHPLKNNPVNRDELISLGINPEALEANGI